MVKRCCFIGERSVTLRLIERCVFADSTKYGSSIPLERTTHDRVSDERSHTLASSIVLRKINLCPSNRPHSFEQKGVQEPPGPRFNHEHCLAQSHGRQITFQKKINRAQEIPNLVGLVDGSMASTDAFGSSLLG